MMIMASASGTPVPAIARLVAADEDTVRDVIHAFNEKGLACLDPKWAGGRPRLISDDDIHHPRLGKEEQGRVVPDPDLRVLGQPDRGPVRALADLVMGDSNHPNHAVLARRLHAYLRWRNANSRHPDVLAAQRRERARIRSQRQQRWGRPRAKAA
jgi:Winged helix-turn helix